MLNKDPQLPTDEAELFGFPLWLRRFFTVIGILFILVTIAVLVVGLLKSNYTSSQPGNLESLCALGIVMLLVVHVPWMEIEIPYFRIRRAPHATQELAEDFRKLVQEERDDKGHRLKQEETMRDLILKFLKEWPHWGFTPLRIKNWGGSRSGYDDLSKLSTMEIRKFLALLEADRKVRTRVSRNGNILYQARQLD